MDDSPPTPEPADHLLLRAYADARSQSAFTQLVARHVDLVYSAARRQLGPDAAHLADDVTQAVFLILAKKADGIGDRVVLAGWLFNTTRHAAANARKIEARRRHHERKGGAMTLTQRQNSNDPSDWEEIAPQLDGALSRLPRADRDALLLKFMQGKSHRAVGDAIGVSEEAARKRVERALERLRALLVIRRPDRATVLPVTAAALATLLTAHAVQATPAAVSAACALAASAHTTTAAAAASTTTSAVAKATACSLTWLHAKAIAACLAVVATLAGGIGYTAHHLHAQAPAGGQAAAPKQPVAPVLPVAAPAQVVEGVVVDPAGKPLAGVEVYAATPKASVNLYNPTQRAKPVLTKDDGTFSLPRPPKDWVLVAMSLDGVAQIEAGDLPKAAPARVVLQPWGQIKGRLFAGDKPLPRQTVHVGIWGFSGDPINDSVTNQTTVRTDKDGRFFLPRVPPGSPVLSTWDQRSSVRSSKWDIVDVLPGQTATIEMGTVGRPAVGRLVIPPGSENTITFATDKLHSAEVTARRIDIDSMPVTPDFQKLSPQEQLHAQWKWQMSPQAREYRRFMFAEQYNIEPDGTFRMDVLRPGKYILSVRLFETDRDNPMMEDVAGANAEFTVPPTPPETPFVADPPIDLGRILLKPAARIAVGQPAPPFEARTSDGDMVKLADYKGRLLVLQFRWPGQGAADVAGMGKAYAAFASDPRVAFLTVHINTDRDAVKKLITDEALEWRQALASRNAGGTGGTGGLPEGYAAVPAMIHLIAPDGAVRRKVLRANELETIIAQVLLEVP